MKPSTELATLCLCIICPRSTSLVEQNGAFRRHGFTAEERTQTGAKGSARFLNERPARNRWKGCKGLGMEEQAVIKSRRNTDI